MKESSPFKSPEDQALLWQGTLLMILLGIAAVLILISFEMLIHPKAKELPVAAVPIQPLDPNRIENGIDVETGFIAEDEYMLVKRNCTGCHSSKMVTQNRATREGWLDMIRWMQKEQKLWDLGANEAAILDYLAKYYGPEDKGRRQNLEIEDWYEISAYLSPPQQKTLIEYLRHV